MIKPEKRKRNVTMGIPIPYALRDAMRRIARRNERSAAAEVRLAIANHVAAHGGEVVNG
jgi:hypothetical protein